MRRFTRVLILSAALVGCDSAAEPTDIATNIPAAPAFAAAVVDPNTLIPIPPPGAVCHADGPQTICHTTVSLAPVNEPVFDLPCGTVYETGTDDRRGIRWYNSESRLVERFVSQDAELSWRLSPLGAGSTVRVTVHANWRNEYAVPGDDATATQVNHGDGATVQAPGLGVISHIAGLDPIEGEHRGIFRDIFEPAVIPVLCQALTL